MSLGDLVGLSYRCVRQNWRLFLKVLFWPSVAYGVAEHSIIHTLDHWVSIAPNSMLSWVPFLIHIGIAVPLVVIWALSAWLMSLRCCAVIRYLLGADTSYEAAYISLKGRGWDIFTAFNLAIVPPIITLTVWLVAAAMAMIVVNRLTGTESMVVSTLLFGSIGFGLTVTVAITGLFGSLLLAAVTLDLLKVKEASRKTLFYMKHRLWRGGSFSCLLTFSIVLFYLSFEGPLIIYDALNQIQANNGVVPPLPVGYLILSCAADIVANLLIFPVVYGGYMLFYRDLKLRLEGEDLTRRIEFNRSASG
jgi:hypothetical protein